jgi:hypothetical protein
MFVGAFICILGVFLLLIILLWTYNHPNKPNSKRYSTSSVSSGGKLSDLLEFYEIDKPKPTIQKDKYNYPSRNIQESIQNKEPYIYDGEDPIFGGIKYFEQPNILNVDIPNSMISKITTVHSDLYQKYYSPYPKNRISFLPSSKTRLLATFEYSPELQDEIRIDIGDIIYLEDSFDDGWGVGYNKSKEARGAFPLKCVQ